MEESEPRLAREEQQCDAACSIGKLPGRDSREVKPGCFDSSDRCSEVVLLVVYIRLCSNKCISIATGILLL
jgi:hypothetical protein